MANHNRAVKHQLATVLLLGDSELDQILKHANDLPTEDACHYFLELLGHSQEAKGFLKAYREHRSSPNFDLTGDSTSSAAYRGRSDLKSARHDDAIDVKGDDNGNSSRPPHYAPPSGLPPVHHHTNPVIEAGKVRARDEVSGCCPRF